MAAILVVEDDPQFIDTVGKMLSRDDHSVVKVNDGEEALEALAGDSYDLVVLDIIMPNKEGLETLAEIRNRFPELRVLCMSGGGRSGNFDPLQLSEKFGADATIAKPFRPAELRQRVSDCLTKAA